MISLVQKGKMKMSNTKKYPARNWDFELRVDLTREWTSEDGWEYVELTDEERDEAQAVIAKFEAAQREYNDLMRKLDRKFVDLGSEENAFVTDFQDGEDPEDPYVKYEHLTTGSLFH